LYVIQKRSLINNKFKVKKRIQLIVILIPLLFSSVYAQDELFNSCLKCDLKGVKKAIEKGANVNTVHSVSGQSALSYSYHCPEVTKYLLEKGANPNGGNYPALVSASSIAALDVMKMLIAKGADVNLKGGGEPPLFKIVQMTNCAECADLLLTNGADKTTKGGIYSNLFRVYASFGSTQAERKEEMKNFGDVLKGYGLAISKDYYNPSEVINAAPSEMAKVLVKHRVDINERTKVFTAMENDGEPPLFTAMNVGKKEIVMSIMDNGADYNATYPVYDPELFLFNIKGKYTPLMYAAVMNQPWLVERLLKESDLTNPVTSGSFITEDYAIVTMKNISAIYLGIMSGSQEVVELLAESSLKWSNFTLQMKGGGQFNSNYGSKPKAYNFGGFKAQTKNKLVYTPSLWADFSKQTKIAKYLRSKKL
jgi:ankyrin repeat protein